MFFCVYRREEERRKAQQPTSTLFVVNFDEERTHEQDLKEYATENTCFRKTLGFSFMESR